MVFLACFLFLVPALLSISVAGIALMKRAPGTAVITDRTFQDPTILLQSNGWYAYASGANGPHVQFATTSRDGFLSPGWDAGPLTDCGDDCDRDAMPDISAATWINMTNSAIFGPDVIDVGDGTCILYFSAAITNPVNPPATNSFRTFHCLGVANATAPGGPFTPMSGTLGDCTISQGGAIDPSGFQDSDGTRYIVYKIDGNNIGDGTGECGQSSYSADAPLDFLSMEQAGAAAPRTADPNAVTTPIMLQKLMSDGMTLDGDPIQLIDRDPGGADGPYVKAPDLRLVDGIYYLTFSSGCYCENNYDISWATGQNGLTGGFAKAQQPGQNAPLAVTQDGVTSPGDASMNIGGTRMAWHYTISGDCNGELVRGMRTADITLANTDITFN